MGSADSPKLCKTILVAAPKPSVIRVMLALGVFQVIFSVEAISSDTRPD